MKSSHPLLTEPLVLSVAVRLPLGATLPTPEVTFGGPPVAAARSLALGADLTMTKRIVSELPRVSAPSVPTTPPAPLDDPPDASDNALSPVLRAVALALAWVAGLAVVLGSVQVGRPSWWPERLAGVGFLGALAVGTTTVAGMVLLGAAAAGVTGRLVWAIRHLSRVVLR